MTRFDQQVQRLRALIEHTDAPHLEALSKVLRGGGDLGPATEEAVAGELLLWIRELEELHAALEVFASTNPVAAEESQHALRLLVTFLERAWGALDVASAAELERLNALGDEARAAVERAAHCISHSTSGLPMRPLVRQPTTRSGVQLRPVMPRSPRTPLPAFKVSAVKPC